MPSSVKSYNLCNLGLRQFAPQCPYVGGSAVYKARSLNFYLQPGAMYDDMKACNAVGVYKQGNTQPNSSNNAVSLISKEEHLLSKLKPHIEKGKLKMNDFILYPNPTENLINFEYNTNESSRIEIYDITGRRIKTVLFVSGGYKTTIDLSDFVSGVYTYKYIVGVNRIKSGKIIKQ